MIGTACIFGNHPFSRALSEPLVLAESRDSSFLTWIPLRRAALAGHGYRDSTACISGSHPYSRAL